MFGIYLLIIIFMNVKFKFGLQTIYLFIYILVNYF